LFACGAWQDRQSSFAVTAAALVAWKAVSLEAAL
jgi:hypothetical protein